MNRWSGKVAVVTGASSGIGAAVCKDLVNHSVIVVGLARRLDRLKELSTKLGKDKFHPIQCDVTKEEDILKAFRWIEKQLGGVDILVNNAGVVHFGMIIDASTDDYRKVIDTNLIAPAICSREAIGSMKKRNVHGHVVNISSIAGLFAEAIHLPIGMYGPSKYALRALGTELRHEIIKTGLKVKISNISPGAVSTEMIANLIKADPEKDLVVLKDKDISDAVIYVLGTPTSVEIPEVTIMPHGEPFGTLRGIKI